MGDVLSPYAAAKERQRMSANGSEVRRAYKYELYRCDKKDHKLRHKLFVASLVWKRFIALQRRYYRLTGQYIPLHAMNTHVLKLRKTRRFALWRALHSQMCQGMCRRVDDAYQRFSTNCKRPSEVSQSQEVPLVHLPAIGL